MVDEDIQVLIANRTHFINYFPGDKLVIKDNLVGFDFTQTDSNEYKAIKSGKSFKTIIDKEMFGFPFIAIIYPLRNLNGEVIGCASIGKSLEKESLIEEISHGLASNLEQINAGIQELSS
jgi:hypothetical protein